MYRRSSYYRWLTYCLTSDAPSPATSARFWLPLGLRGLPVSVEKAESLGLFQQFLGSPLGISREQYESIERRLRAAQDLLIGASDDLPPAFCQGYGMDVILRELDWLIMGLAIDLNDYFRIEQGEVGNMTQPGEQHLGAIGNTESSNGRFEGEFGGGTVGVEEVRVLK